MKNSLSVGSHCRGNKEMVKSEELVGLKGVQACPGSQMSLAEIMLELSRRCNSLSGRLLFLNPLPLPAFSHTQGINHLTLETTTGAVCGCEVGHVGMITMFLLTALTSVLGVTLWQFLLPFVSRTIICHTGFRYVPRPYTRRSMLSHRHLFVLEGTSSMP